MIILGFVDAYSSTWKRTMTQLLQLAGMSLNTAYPPNLGQGIMENNLPCLLL
jgi:hypothetical protein